MTDNEKELALALPGEWALKKTLGPALEELGDDLRRLYAVGRDKILAAALKKIKDPDDGKRANLRVTRDVLWNGAFSDSEFCAEYFGGILASSRSDDGKCDDVVQYADVVKSLSSKQLHLHYVIYNCLNKLWCSVTESVNVGAGDDLFRHQAWFSGVELVEQLKLNVQPDLYVLYKEGLITNFMVADHTWDGKSFPYVSAQAATFGVLLYACAHNRLEDWRAMADADFGNFDGICLPQFFAPSINALVGRAVD